MGSLTLVILTVCCTFIVTRITSPFASADSEPSAYDVLREYDFPVGILPKGVTSYELNAETGEFSVHMNNSCSFNIESYELKYESTISGVISKDKLTNLKGVGVKVLVLWLNIVEVTRQGCDLAFFVGIGSAVFPVDNFDQCPQCGCGFDCNKLNGLLIYFLRIVNEGT